MSTTTIQSGLAIIKYKADGVTSEFDIPFGYLRNDDIHVYKEGQPVGFTLLHDYVIHLDNLPSKGEVITIQRITDNTQIAVTSSTQREYTFAEIRTLVTKNLYIAQEIIDRADNKTPQHPATTSLTTFTQDINADGHQIIRLGEADSAGDAVSFGQVKNMLRPLTNILFPQLMGGGLGHFLSVNQKGEPAWSTLTRRVTFEDFNSQPSKYLRAIWGASSLDEVYDSLGLTRSGSVPSGSSTGGGGGYTGPIGLNQLSPDVRAAVNEVLRNLRDGHLIIPPSTGGGTSGPAILADGTVSKRHLDQMLQRAIDAVQSVMTTDGRLPIGTGGGSTGGTGGSREFRAPEKDSPLDHVNAQAGAIRYNTLTQNLEVYSDMWEPIGNVYVPRGGYTLQIPKYDAKMGTKAEQEQVGCLRFHIDKNRLEVYALKGLRVLSGQALLALSGQALQSLPGPGRALRSRPKAGPFSGQGPGRIHSGDQKVEAEVEPPRPGALA